MKVKELIEERGVHGGVAHAQTGPGCEVDEVICTEAQVGRSVSPATKAPLRAALARGAPGSWEIAPMMKGGRMNLMAAYLSQLSRAKWCWGARAQAVVS